MQGLPIIRNPRIENVKQTSAQFPRLVTLFEDSVFLLVDATRILAQEGAEIDRYTSEGAQNLRPGDFYQPCLQVRYGVSILL